MAQWHRLFVCLIQHYSVFCNLTIASVLCGMVLPFSPTSL